MKKNDAVILLVCRDPKLVKDLTDSFSGMPVDILTADNGFDAMSLSIDNKPGLLVFESDLPRLNGIDTARIIKQDPKFATTPVFFLISNSADYKAISELKTLADDCFLRPVNVPFLVHRIKEAVSLSDKVNGETVNGHSLKHNGDLFIDRETYMIHYRGQELSFPKKEFELIFLLASSPEKVFTRKDIFRNVWNKDLNLRSARTIDVHIRKLREKLQGINIVTVKGVGYKLSMK